MEAMTGTAARDLSEFVEPAAAGDEAAFTRIVAAYDNEMYRVCVAVCRDQTIAADAVQSAWSIAWRKLKKVRDPSRLRPWLIAIAVNEAKTLLSRRGKRAQVEVVAGASDRAGGLDPATGIEMIDLLAALDRLDPDERALLAMRYVAGFNATELAAALGISPSGTRTRLERLTARLREELA